MDNCLTGSQYAAGLWGVLPNLIPASIFGEGKCLDGEENNTTVSSAKQQGRTNERVRGQIPTGGKARPTRAAPSGRRKILLAVKAAAREVFHPAEGECDWQ